MLIDQTIKDFYNTFGPSFTPFEETIRNGVDALLGELYVAFVMKEYTKQLERVEESFKNLISLINNADEGLYTNKIDPWDAYKIIQKEKEIDKNKKEVLERIIATDAKASCAYAINVLKGPLLKGEDAISTSPIFSFAYVK